MLCFKCIVKRNRYNRSSTLESQNILRKHLVDCKLDSRIPSLISSVLIVSLILSSTFILSAFGNGFSAEDLPPASVGNRQISLFVQMSPPVLTLENQQQPTITLRLYDRNTNQNITHVTYFVKLEKNGNVLLTDWFHDHEGDLQIQVRPKQADRTVIYGEKEPILEGWMQRGTVPVVAEGPIFLEGGLYHFIVEIFTIDTDKTIFAQKDLLKYEAWVSVADITSYQVKYDNKDNRVDVVSYYDRIEDFNFDSEKLQLKFSTPFNWDLSRIEKAPTFLVHEEVRIPRSFAEFAGKNYTATAEGVQVSGNELLVDDVNPDYIIVHYLLSKESITKLATNAEKSKNGMGKIIFTLAPTGAVPEVPKAIAEEAPTPPIMKATDKGTLNIELSWSPIMMEPDKETRFVIRFLQPDTNEQQLHIDYRFYIIKDGEQVFTTPKAHTTLGNSTIAYTFLSAGNYVVGVELLGLLFEEIPKEAAEFPITVIPEFSLMQVVIIMAAGTAMSLAVRKFHDSAR